MSQPEQQVGLVRAIGRWSLTSLVINSIIGSGIFGLPSDIMRRVGDGAPFAYLIATIGMGLIMASFAEVASQFRDAGGPYLYARAAFGRFAGVQMGWFAYLARITGAAANANLFVVYLGQFWPNATDPGVRAAVLLMLVGVFAIVNICGVKAGARVSDAFAVIKLLPIVLFAAAGLWFVGANVHVGPSGAPGSEWLQAVLALVFAFGGFETAMMPMGEVKDPRRDAPFALFTGLVVVAIAYLAVQLVVMGAITDPAELDSARGLRPSGGRSGTRLHGAGRRDAHRRTGAVLDVRQPVSEFSGVPAPAVRLRRARRHAARPRSRAPAIPDALRRGAGARDARLRVRDLRQFHVERDPLRGRATGDLRRRLRRGAGPTPPRAQCAAPPSARRLAPARVRDRILRRARRADEDRPRVDRGNRRHKRTRQLALGEVGVLIWQPRARCSRRVRS